MTEVDDAEPRTHYHFRISLRVRHPSMDPGQISEALNTEPKRAWKFGTPRQTPKGNSLPGTYRETAWSVEVAVGRWPSNVNDAIGDVLNKLARYRAFLHRIREEGGAAELFVGWFLENQSGEVLSHQWLALAGDLQVDLTFDIYPPDQPQHERDMIGRGIE